MHFFESATPLIYFEHRINEATKSHTRTQLIPSGYVKQFAIEAMAIEIVHSTIENCDVPLFFVSLPEGTS